MLTAHDAYLRHRELLFVSNTELDININSKKTVQNYLENRAIWKELQYFKEKGEILGKHPIFSWMKRLSVIRAMNIGDLVKLKIRLENNLVKNKARVRKQSKHPETANRIIRIKEMQLELVQVNQLLNIK